MSFSRTDTVTASVLIIEPDPLMLTAIGSVLNSAGHHAVLARTERIATESIQDGKFDSIVLSIEDLERGCDFARRLRSFPATVDTPVVFMVPELSSSWTESLAAAGGAFSILKPVDPDNLIELVEKALWLPHLADAHRSASKQMPAPKSQNLGAPKPKKGNWITL